jgi:hypothetical protein
MNDKVENGVVKELVRVISLQLPSIYCFAVEQLGSFAGS